MTHALRKLIGSQRSLNLSKEELRHRWSVINRHHDIMKVRNDIENGYLENMEYQQLYVEDFPGTHPRKSIWKSIINLLKQLLP